jgi:hypothetical protein
MRTVEGTGGVMMWDLGRCRGEHHPGLQNQSIGARSCAERYMANRVQNDDSCFLCVLHIGLYITRVLQLCYLNHGGVQGFTWGQLHGIWLRQRAPQSGPSSLLQAHLQLPLLLPRLCLRSNTHALKHSHEPAHAAARFTNAKWLSLSMQNSCAWLYYNPGFQQVS